MRAVVLDIGCEVCDQPRPLSERGLCAECEQFVELIRKKWEKRPTADPGPKPRGKRPKCPGCGGPMRLGINEWVGKWAFFCIGPCVEW